MRKKNVSNNLRMLHILCIVYLCIALPSFAQDREHNTHVSTTASNETKKDLTSSFNLSTTSLSNNSAWPEPIDDSALRSYLLFDNLEYQMIEGANPLRWDILGWYGGDLERFWFKSEGRSAFAPKEGESEIEFQALYGKLISPFFDLQAGVRVDPRFDDEGDPSRVYGVLGVQGIAPYEFDVEPTLFLSERGQLSGRLTATYDILFTQRLILQPRLESTVAVEDDANIGVGSGLNDLELGARLRYEIHRRFAPYIGVTWRESFGETRSLALEDGKDAGHLTAIVGVRMWF